MGFWTIGLRSFGKGKTEDVSQDASSRVVMEVLMRRVCKLIGDMEDAAVAHLPFK